MNEPNLLSLTAKKIMPAAVHGAMNILTYPSPPEVIVDAMPKGGAARAEVLLPLRAGSGLHTHSLNKNNRPYFFNVYCGTLNMPEECIVCNGSADQQVVVEAQSQVKMELSSKLVINSPNAMRMWTSIQRDRYWYAVPVCSQHKDKVKHSVFFGADRADGNLLLWLPNKQWALNLVNRYRYQVKSAVYKDEAFIKKRLLTVVLAGLGGFAFAIALMIKLMFVSGTAVTTLAAPGWGWTIVFGALFAWGLYLAFKNRSENLIETNTIEQD